MKEFIITWMKHTLGIGIAAAVLTVPALLTTLTGSAWWFGLYVPILALVFTLSEKWG